MKIKYVLTNEEIRDKRKKAYLHKYSIEDQIEGLIEDKMGNPKKLNEIIAYFKEVRNNNPKLEEAN